jgi:hypothetical protein
MKKNLTIAVNYGLLAKFIMFPSFASRGLSAPLGVMAPLEMSEGTTLEGKSTMGLLRLQC